MGRKRIEFSESQLKEMEDRYKAGEIPAEIALVMGCSRDVVRTRLIQRNISLRQARENKRCLICGVDLDGSNTTWYRQKNYIYKCNDCIKKEKAIQANEARKREPGLAAERAHKHIAKLKAASPKKYTAKQMCASAKKRAVALGVPSDIDPIYIESICFDTCPVLGFELKYGGGGKTKNSASVDRIIPALGYVKGNVMVMSLLANLMKNDATPEELLLFADWVRQTYGRDGS